MENNLSGIVPEVTVEVESPVGEGESASSLEELSLEKTEEIYRGVQEKMSREKLFDDGVAKAREKVENLGKALWGLANHDKKIIEETTFGDTLAYQEELTLIRAKQQLGDQFHLRGAKGWTVAGAGEIVKRLINEESIAVGYKKEDWGVYKERTEEEKEAAVWNMVVPKSLAEDSVTYEYWGNQQEPPEKGSPEYSGFEEKVAQRHRQMLDFARSETGTAVSQIAAQRIRNSLS